MAELLKHPEQAEVWQLALDGHPVDWDALFGEHRAVVDWTASALYPELAAAYPDAIVVLSVRDVDGWWRSVRDTLFDALQSVPVPVDASGREAPSAQRRLFLDMLYARFTPDWADEVAAKQAFVRHNEAVRAAIPASRLVEWRPGDGWEPLCSVLGVPVPEEPFPHVNTTADFRAWLKLDQASGRTSPPAQPG